MSDAAALGGLFLIAFVAATILPAQSEAALAGLILTTKLSPWTLVAVASVGNVLGSCLNWLLGRSIETFKDRRWFPVSERLLEKAQSNYQRYGRWTLLLSWVPVIGDPITVAAGVMKEKIVPFVLYVSVAKTLRYFFIALTVLYMSRD